MTLEVSNLFGTFDNVLKKHKLRQCRYKRIIGKKNFALQMAQNQVSQNEVETHLSRDSQPFKRSMNLLNKNL
jgi:hypothetical protein